MTRPFLSKLKYRSACQLQMLTGDHYQSQSSDQIFLGQRWAGKADSENKEQRKAQRAAKAERQ